MQKIFTNKKGDMGQGVGWIVSFAVLIITVVVTALIVESLDDNQNTDNNPNTSNAAENASRQGAVGIQNFASLLGVIGTILIAIVVIGLVIGGMAGGIRFE